jgi:hypothetical protein
MTTITVTQGATDAQGFVEATGTDTWADLTTWSATTSWNATPNTVIVQADDDLTTSAYRIPEVEIDADGSTSLVLKTSDTGAFAGEESTITFVEGTEYAVPKARYYRYIVTVEADSATLIPQFYNIEINYDTDYVIEVLDDVDIPSTGTNSAGDTLVTTGLSVVKNVQATALQGGVYVEDGYIVSQHNTTNGLARTPRTVNNNGVTLATDVVKWHYNSFEFDGTDYFSVPQVGQDFNDLTTDWTFEFWMYPTNVGTLQYLAGATWFQLQINSDGSLFFRYNTTDGLEVSIPSTDTVSDNTWYHIAIAHDTSASQFRMWIDGVYQPIGASDTDFYDGSTTAQSDALIIGDEDNTASNGDKFQGYMDDIRWSTVDRYGPGTGSPVATPINRFYNDADTSLLLSEALTDDGDTDFGSGTYFVTQYGGIATVESKSPLAIRVQDFEGTVWDGTVDLVLRGYPYISYQGGSLGPVEI